MSYQVARFNLDGQLELVSQPSDDQEWVQQRVDVLNQFGRAASRIGYSAAEYFLVEVTVSYGTTWGSGLMTTNAARAQAGLDPVGEYHYADRFGALPRPPRLRRLRRRLRGHR